MNIKAIIFDVMGVIFKVGDDTKELLIPYVLTLDPSLSKDFINKLYIQASLGKITAEEFWLKLGFDRKHIKDIEEYYLNNYLTLDEYFIETVRDVKTKYKVALLSNDIDEWSVFLRKKFGIEKYIDYAFISSKVGYRKPSIEIYKQALDTMNFKASECIFIDDSPERVDMACELGIKSVLFNRNKVSYAGLQIFSFSELKRLLL